MRGTKLYVKGGEGLQDISLKSTCIMLLAGLSSPTRDIHTQDNNAMRVLTLT